MAIDKRQKIELHGRAAETEEMTIPKNANPDFYNAFFKRFNFHPKKLVATFPLNIESGLGSSASAAVALVGALAKATNKSLGKNRIADLAWKIEVKDLGLYGGKQDQYAAVYGGMNAITFGDNIALSTIDKKIANKVSENILLFYIGENRKKKDIQDGFKELNVLQVSALNAIKMIAKSAYSDIKSLDIDEIGRHLMETWLHKMSSNAGITTDRIDHVYKTAIKNGALGGKVCGSGGGGHMVFVTKEKDKLIKSLGDIGATLVKYESLDFVCRIGDKT